MKKIELYVTSRPLRAFCEVKPSMRGPPVSSHPSRVASRAVRAQVHGERPPGSFCLPRAGLRHADLSYTLIFLGLSFCLFF